MKKSFAVILLFLAAVLVFCGCDGKDETQNTTDTGDINEVEHFDTKEDDYPFVIWSEGDVKVCAKNEDAYKGADNKKIKLTIGNESVVFNASFSFRIGNSILCVNHREQHHPVCDLIQRAFNQITFTLFPCLQ